MIAPRRPLTVTTGLMLFGLLLVACASAPGDPSASGAGVSARVPEETATALPTLTAEDTPTQLPEPTSTDPPAERPTATALAPPTDEPTPTPATTPTPTPAPPTATEPSGLAQELPDLGPAPDFDNKVWINADAPLTLQALRGKVVLVEFWTFG
jgi:hypothetical protein